MNRSYRISRVTDPAASLALISLADAKAALGITDNSQDAVLTQQIAQVSAAVHNYCDRIFPRQSYRDQFRRVCDWMAPGQPLMARQFPIILDVDGDPILTVTQDGILVDSTGWEVDPDSGWIYRLDGSSSLSPSWTGTSIVIDYDGGYDVIPADLQGAALEWFTIRSKTTSRDPALRSRTIPDVISETWVTAADLITNTSVSADLRQT